MARRRMANRLTPTGTRQLADLRRQLLDPPTPLQRTKTDTPNQKSESVGAVAYHDNQGTASVVIYTGAWTQPTRAAVTFCHAEDSVR